MNTPERPRPRASAPAPLPASSPQASFEPVGQASDSGSETDGAPLEPLPLFPLRTVLFPDGLLPLKIFELRYLDLIARCMKTGTGFGVVALREGAEAGAQSGPTLFERIGVEAALLDVDSPQAGLLMVRTQGRQRFRIHTYARQPDGLWLAQVRKLPMEAPQPPAAERAGVVQALRQAIAALAAQGAEPFAEPYRYDDAGWVANRWCELLPIGLAAKQRLMELADPNGRLSLVDDYLRGRGVIDRT